MEPWLLGSIGILMVGKTALGVFLLYKSLWRSQYIFTVNRFAQSNLASIVDTVYASKIQEPIFATDLRRSPFRESGA